MSKYLSRAAVRSYTSFSCSIVIILRNFSFKLQRYNNLGTDYMDFTVFNERTMHSVQSVPKIQMNQILYSSYIFSISAA